MKLQDDVAARLAALIGLHCTIVWSLIPRRNGISRVSTGGELSLMLIMSDLRDSLQDIACTVSLDDQPYAIEGLRKEYRHTIDLLEGSKLQKCNCYEYALNIDLELASWLGNSDLPDLFCAEHFISGLILQLQRIDPTDVSDNALAFYFNNDTIAHAGVMKGSRVISKWGKGHIYRHALLEVPANYGKTVRFYGAITNRLANRYFVDYARKHPDFEAIQDEFEEQFGHLYPRSH
jgi:hypothetical protein